MGSPILIVLTFIGKSTRIQRVTAKVGLKCWMWTFISDPTALRLAITLDGPTHEILVHITSANIQGTKEPAYLGSLAKAFLYTIHKNMENNMGLDGIKPVFWGWRTTKKQTSLHNSAV